MIVLLGKTASGKDTILNELVKKYNYRKMITYTTRPMRKGEIQDKTYHFISDEEFLRRNAEYNSQFLNAQEKISEMAKKSDEEVKIEDKIKTISQKLRELSGINPDDITRKIVENGELF